MGILVSDFDGTVTRYDFFDRVRKRWPFPPQEDPWEKFVSGEITHFQALAEIFASIRAPEAELLELADSTELDASFAEIRSGFAGSRLGNRDRFRRVRLVYQVLT